MRYIVSARLPAALLFFGFTTLHAQELSNLPRQDFWVTDGAVNAIAVTNDRVFIGGSFRYLGPHTGGGVPVDLETMEPTPKFPKVNGTVSAVEPDGQGGWFIGGNFNTVGGRPRTNLAHITAAGEVNLAWTTPATGDHPLSSVHHLTLDGDTLYAAGSFDQLGGQSRKFVGALLSATGEVKDWAPQLDSNVLAIAVSPKAVYVGGKFRYVGESNRNYLAAIDKATGLATSWDGNANVFPHGFVTNGFMTAIATYENLVIVAGAFNGFFGPLYLSAKDDTTGDFVWAVGDSQRISDLKVRGDQLYVVGDFSAIGGDGDGGGTVTRNGLAALNPNSGEVLDWFPRLKSIGTMKRIALSGSTAYVGGDFTSPNPSLQDGVLTNANNIVAFDLTTGEEISPRRPLNNGPVLALAVQGNHVYIGGTFDSVGGVPQNYLAELDRRNGSPKPWQPDVDLPITAMTLHGERLLIGGWFSIVDGQPRSRLAAFDLPEMKLLPWAPQLKLEGGSAHSLGVTTLLAYEDSLFVAGELTSVGDQPRTNLARISLTTGEALEWRADANSSVDSAVIANGRLYVGGRFTTLGGVARNYLGAVDLETAEISAWDPSPDHWVTSVSANSSAVYSAGPFNYVSGETRTGYAAHDLIDHSLLPWNLESLDSLFVDINRVLATDTAVYANGFFTYLPPPRAHISLVAVDPTTGTPSHWDTRPLSHQDPEVFLQDGDTLFVVGIASGSSRKRSGITVYEPPGFSRITRLTSNGTEIQIKLTADQGREFIIERTSDFQAWAELGTHTAWEGVIEIEDTISSDVGPVIYRAVSSPPE